MTKQEAIEILELHQKWRKGDYDIELQSPHKITEATDLLILESKNPIDLNKLRDEFFSECVDRRAFCEIGESFDRVVSLAPHDMFEWIKNKLTTKL